MLNPFEFATFIMNMDSKKNQHILNLAFDIQNISLIAIGWLILNLFPIG
jgi:hypothetical protein